MTAFQAEGSAVAPSPSKMLTRLEVPTVEPCLAYLVKYVPGKEVRALISTHLSLEPRLSRIERR